MRLHPLCLALSVTGLATAAQGQTLSGADAQERLFNPQGVMVELTAGDLLPPDQADLLRIVGEQQPYHGAIAISPDEGLMVEATVAAANYHDTDAASVAALAECETKRKGATPCAIVALIRPQGWADRGFSLSAQATEAFAKDYKGRGARALAASVGTGVWGIATGEGAAEAALAACAAMATPPASDCALVVSD